MLELTGRERTRLAKLKIGEESFFKKLPREIENLLDFSKFKYRGLQNKSIVKCPIHGEIEMRPDNLLQGKGCNQCARSNKPIKALISRKDLKSKLKMKLKLPKGKEFQTNANNLEVICPIHGKTTTRVKYLIEKGICSKCGKAEGIKVNQSSNTTEFVTKASRLHDYDFSKVVYINAKTKVNVICPTHGEFRITPNNLLSGKGCNTCKNSLKQIQRKGKKFKVQGYEPQALDYMLSFGLKVSEIDCYESGNVPSIKTSFKLDTHTHSIHYPDFYIPKRNLVVEVKSLGTLGLEERTLGKYTPKQAFKLMQHKSKQAKKQGYKYLCLVMNKEGDRIDLPKDWDSISRSKVLDFIHNL